MCAGQLEDIYRSMENMDPVTYEALTSQFKSQSKLLEDVGEKWNMPLLAEDAKYYQQEPEVGMGRATAIGASIYAPYAAEAAYPAMAEWMYGAATPGVAQGGQQAAMLAAQTGDFGAYGLGKTMEAANYAKQSGIVDMASGLLSGGGAKGMSGSQKVGQQMLMGQALGAMNPQQPPQPMMAPPKQQGPQEPLPQPYSMNSLDQKPPWMSPEEWERMKRTRGGY